MTYKQIPQIDLEEAFPNISEDVRKANPDLFPVKSLAIKPQVQHIKKIAHAEFQGQVCKVASMDGWEVQYWWKSYHSPSGFPDLFLCRPKRIAIIELKVGKDKLSHSQEKWKALLSQCPQIEYRLWRPEDWDEILEFLK